MDRSSNTPVVLVVEDEPLLRQLSVYQLIDAGYEVIEASTADEALNIMNSGNDVKVVFTDINMPGSLDGLELAQRCHSRWPYVKVIVTSGAVRVRPADVPDGGRFLAKPYSLAELTRTVSELAGRPQQATLSLH